MRVYNHENRLTTDKCAYLNHELQNKSIHDHTFENFYFTKDCKCDVLDDFLIDNNMVIKDGYGFSTGCVIDNDSDLRLKAIWTNEREKVQLCTRWNQGVPNINKGGFIPNIESLMKNGDDTSDIRNCDRITEKNFDRFVPLVGCLASTVQNANNIVEPWVRGGIHTRNDVRSSEYLQKCGFERKETNWVKKQ